MAKAKTTVEKPSDKEIIRTQAQVVRELTDECRRLEAERDAYYKVYCIFAGLGHGDDGYYVSPEGELCRN